MGDSRTVLPELLERIGRLGEELGFVLIDGDHSTEGVHDDINNVLRSVPTRPIFVVFHDSFHPPCRRGILSASWSECDYVHYVEVDFVPGVYHLEAFDTAQARSMYGGLALAMMQPQRRAGPLVIHESQKGLFETMLLASRHLATRRPLLVRALQKAKWLALRLRAGRVNDVRRGATSMSESVLVVGADGQIGRAASSTGFGAPECE